MNHISDEDDLLSCLQLGLSLVSKDTVAYSGVIGLTLFMHVSRRLLTGDKGYD